ncbi:MAG: 3-isopropylmalate dehydratase small subunit, partial [Actinomycetota bacterium]
IAIDLPARAVRAPGLDETFEIDEYVAWRLIEGLDDIGLTLRRTAEIADFESKRASWLPTA